MKMIKLYIPRNLNLTQLIAEQLPVYNGKKEGINEQNLAYICHCIIKYWLRYRDDYAKSKYKFGYVPLHSQYLKNIIPESKNCLDFLIASGIINCDRQYIPGEKPRSYTFCPAYLGHGLTNITAEGKLKARLDKFYTEKKKTNKAVQLLTKKRVYLIKTLTSPLLLIEADARDAIMNKYIENTTDIDDVELIARANIIKDTELLLIDTINNLTEDDIVVDKSGYRLHSPVTRLPKYLRPYLTYGGKRLVAVDISNSQPYFGLLLLNPEFYRRRGGYGKHRLSLRNIHRELFELLAKPGKSSSNSPIMLRKIIKTLTNKGNYEFENYKNDVVSGQFYEKFLNVNENTPNYKKEREDVKKQFLMVLNDRVAKKGLASRFRNKYPEVFEVFDDIKSVETGEYVVRVKGSKSKRVKAIFPKGYQEPNGNVSPEPVQTIVERVVKTERMDAGYKMFSALVQRTESRLLLDVVCARVAKENPEVPLITIHDCIATTQGYINYVNDVLNEELAMAMDIPPKVKYEYWDGRDSQ